jgi:hypothetical protein
MRSSLRLPIRSMSTPTETLSTESRFTAVRLPTGSSPGSSTTSLASPRIVVVHGAINLAANGESQHPGLRWSCRTATTGSGVSPLGRMNAQGASANDRLVPGTRNCSATSSRLLSSSFLTELCDPVFAVSCDGFVFTSAATRCANRCRVVHSKQFGLAIPR